MEENMGAIKKIARKSFGKLIGMSQAQGVVQPVAPAAPPPAPAAPAPVAQAPVVTQAAPAKAAAPAQPQGPPQGQTMATSAETQVAMKKRGRKPLTKTSAQGVLGDPVLFKPTLLG